MSDCYKTSNNKYFNCPPRMADGRHFTEYRPGCHIENSIRSENNINNGYQYRLFLTQNANALMESNRAYACQKNCCGPCKKPYETGTMLPEETRVKCDGNQCETIFNQKGGLGQGRIYSEHKYDLLPENMPVNQKNNYCTPPEDNFRYYPTSSNYDNITRLTVPGGGKDLSGGDNSIYN